MRLSWLPIFLMLKEAMAQCHATPSEECADSTDVKFRSMLVTRNGRSVLATQREENTKTDLIVQTTSLAYPVKQYSETVQKHWDPSNIVRIGSNNKRPHEWTKCTEEKKGLKCDPKSGNPPEFNEYTTMPKDEWHRLNDMNEAWDDTFRIFRDGAKICAERTNVYGRGLLAPRNWSMNLEILCEPPPTPLPTPAPPPPPFWTSSYENDKCWRSNKGLDTGKNGFTRRRENYRDNCIQKECKEGGLSWNTEGWGCNKEAKDWFKVYCWGKCGP